MWTNPEDRGFYACVYRLSRLLKERLHALRAATGAPPPQVCRTHASPAAIFLAEAAPDLRGYGTQLANALKGRFSIRSAQPFPAALDAYREAVQRELQDCVLFVQILGRHVLDKPPELPQGYEALQLELAKTAKVPILRWMDPGVDQGQLDDPALYKQHPVIVENFSDFQRRVEAAVRLRAIPPPSLPEADIHVLIRAATADRDLACDIGEQLHADHGIGYEVADEDDSLADLVLQGSFPYRGLMVVYDRCHPSWAKRQVRDCRVIDIDRKDPALAVAVYDPPREGKAPLGIKVPRFLLLADFTGPALTPFVAALAKVRTP